MKNSKNWENGWKYKSRVIEEKYIIKSRNLRGLKVKKKGIKNEDKNSDHNI